MKKIALVIVMLFAFSAQAQNIRLKKGNLYDARMEKLDGRQIRFLLADRPDLLKKYQAYHTKSFLGGLLLGTGAGLLLSDLALALTTVAPYPSAATYIGGAMTAVSIPVLIGRKKKLETVVKEYNRAKSTANTGLKIDEVHILANQNGAGVRLSF